LFAPFKSFLIDIDGGYKKVVSAAGTFVFECYKNHSAPKKMSLLKKLEGDQMQRNVEREIRDLHQIFVTWFRGDADLSELQTELELKLLPGFSHVAPNGHMVQGRKVLLEYLNDKYACYKDQVFEIQVYNVRILWQSEAKILACYEEWQSWDVPTTTEEGASTDRQQFGRLSTCLLDHNKSSSFSDTFQWIHVHETWMEAEEPVLLEEGTTAAGNHGNAMMNRYNLNEEDATTVMTGPVPPEQLAQRYPERFAMQQPQQQRPVDPYHPQKGDSTNTSEEEEDLLPPPVQQTSSKNVSTPLTSRADKAPTTAATTTTMDDDKSLSQSGQQEEELSFSEEPQQLPWLASNGEGDNATNKRLLILVGNSISKIRSAQRTLAEHSIAYHVVQGEQFDQTARRQQLFDISGLHGEYPQFFKLDKDFLGRENVTFWGTLDDFERSNAAGTLWTDLGLNNDFSTTSFQHNKDGMDDEESFDEEDILMGDQVEMLDDVEENDEEEEEDDDDDEGGAEEEADVQDEHMDEEEDEEDEEDTSEAKDEVASLKKPEPPMTKEEQAFLEASQGILFFEEEDEGPPQPPAPKEDAIINLDRLMESESENVASAAMLSLHSEADASHKRHVSPGLSAYAKPLMYENALVGLSIAGFDIGTSQGPIADAKWCKETGAALEKRAQPKKGGARKICLPEMVFPTAHVALEGHSIWLSWDASDALEAWAKCHRKISLNSRASYKGVSVIKSKDAAAWEDRRTHGEGAITDASAVFHYDWTFSTPFSVKMEGGKWTELDESGMRMDLLKDKSVPILFYDEIVLYECDLHDNGHSQYKIKLRIMPTCSYVLARSWVRVDNVIVRVRETRVLIDFFGIQPKIYRDVVWRECAWEDLPKHGLPTTAREWNCDQVVESPKWNDLLQRIPQVELPSDILPFSVLEYGNLINFNQERSS
jgi:type 2A phosphatase activator TIP41